MKQEFSHVRTALDGGILTVTLARPEAINALSCDMIRAVRQSLGSAAQDDGVVAILFRGEGGRGFCAGGDIKAFYQACCDVDEGKTKIETAAEFFRQEYAMDREIFEFPKPVVVFMHGITMGGGYGVAGNCRHRIVTDGVRFAMPEVGIGFFPDVGSLYHLRRAPGNFGRYLALTGNEIGAGDMLAAGLADYYMAPDAQGPLIEALSAGISEGEDAENIILSFAGKPPKAELMDAQGGRIEEIFAHESVEDIFAALERDGSEWAMQTLATMHKRSPSSMRVTAEHWSRCAELDLPGCCARISCWPRIFSDFPIFARESAPLLSIKTAIRNGIRRIWKRFPMSGYRRISTRRCWNYRVFRYRVVMERKK